MDEFEIVQMYRQAKYKSRQIGILVELSTLSKREVLDILEKHGEKVRRTERTPLTKWTPERLALLRSLVEEGTSTKELTERFGVSACAVNNVCSRYGIRRQPKISKAKKESHSRESD